MNKKHNIATVISYCTNDYQFIHRAIDAVKPFSKQVIVPVVDHFFDGTKEDRKLLDKTYSENKDGQFIEIEYDHKQTLCYGSRFWHCMTRWIGFVNVEKDIDYILFIDSDEIAETKKVIEWLNTYDYTSYSYIYLANYWYFREARFQANTLEYSPVLVRKDRISKRHIFHEAERGGFLQLSNGLDKCVSTDEIPMFHHYSWVRTKKEMLKKVKTWAHNKDRNWTQLVEEEFEREFSGADFIHGYSYKTVKPYIDLAEVETKRKLEPGHFKVKKISSNDLSDLIQSIEEKGCVLNPKENRKIGIFSFLSDKYYQIKSWLGFGTTRNDKEYAREASVCAGQDNNTPARQSVSPGDNVADRIYIKFDEIDGIDLTELSVLIRSEEFKGYFLEKKGKEHYKFLAYMSTKFNHVTLFDIGTYKGVSAIALSYHSNNKIVSYDIGNFLDLHSVPHNITCEIGNALSEELEELLKSPLILLDTLHDGIFESKFYQALLLNNYKGILVLDDIHLNRAMKKFWKSIKITKYDITEIGHWSGTGLVDFSNHVKLIKL